MTNIPAFKLFAHEPRNNFLCEVANLEDGLSSKLETDDPIEPSKWLHRNDSYIPERIGPRMVLTDPLPASIESGYHNHLMQGFFLKKTYI